MKNNTKSFGNVLKKKKRTIFKNTFTIANQKAKKINLFRETGDKNYTFYPNEKTKKILVYIKTLKSIIIRSKVFKKWILQFLKKHWKYSKKNVFINSTWTLIKIEKKNKKKIINKLLIKKINKLFVIKPSMYWIEKKLINLEATTQGVPLKLKNNYLILKKRRSELFLKTPSFQISLEKKYLINRARRLRRRMYFHTTYVNKSYEKKKYIDKEKKKHQDKEKNKMQLEKKQNWLETQVYRWLNRQKRLKRSKSWNLIAKIPFEMQKKQNLKKNRLTIKTAVRKNGLPFMLQWNFTSFRQNFLKTSFGLSLLTAHQQKHNMHQLNNNNNSKVFFNKHYKIRFSGYNYSLLQELQQRHKLGWYYNNIIWRKLVSKLHFDERFTYNIFLIYWRQHKLRPWLNYLQGKRRLYSALFPLRRKEHYWIKKYFSIPYLQKKKPFRQKKNKLYQTHNYLLYNFRNRGLRKKKKFKHIKIILSRIILPFYGNLTQKQFTNLRKRTQRKKPETISRDTMHLSQFECRLDVTVYRLNLAPTIFWARKLIETGSIFVSSTSNATLWKTMYGSFKKFLFPLKLRDPKNLYRNSSSNAKVYSKILSITKNHPKFLLEPVIKSQYLVKPGEIIYCAPGTFLNQFKTNSILWKKPIPNHYLTFSDITETELNLNSHNQKYSHMSASNTSENKLTVFATLLFSPTYANLNPTDRISQSFVRWIYL